MMLFCSADVSSRVVALGACLLRWRARPHQWWRGLCPSFSRRKQTILQTGFPGVFWGRFFFLSVVASSMRVKTNSVIKALFCYQCGWEVALDKGRQSRLTIQLYQGNLFLISNSSISKAPWLERLESLKAWIVELCVAYLQTKIFFIVLPLSVEFITNDLSSLNYDGN